MPIYEYDCERCGRFEVSQKMSDAPLSTHACGARVERKISRTHFTLKGGGWYADGYGSSGSRGNRGSSSSSS